MSQRTQQPPNYFDPLIAVRTFRDIALENWAKVMITWVNTELYAQVTGMVLNATLTVTAPVREMVETTMTRVLPQLNMPTRDDVMRLAERMTNIEMRLDDLDARLYELQEASREEVR